jgi:hypothetical protein
MMVFGAGPLEAGPIPAVDGVVRWRLLDLAQWVFEGFSVSLSVQTMSRVLREAGYRKLSARPRHHAQDAQAIPTFKNVWPAPSARVIFGWHDRSASTYPVSGVPLAKMDIRAPRSS